MQREKIDTIREILENRKKPLSIAEIARLSNYSRTTVARYLDRMHLSGQVRLFEIGKAKKFLLATEKNSFNLYDLSSNFILILDQDLRVVFVNEAYLLFSRKILSDLIGKNIESLKLDIFASSEVLQSLLRFKGEGIENHTIEFYIHNTLVIYTITIAKVQFASNNLATAIIAQDVTHKRKLEEQVHFLASIVSSSEDGIIGVGIDSTIISWNKGAERILGYSDTEIIGKKLSLLHPPEFEEHQKSLLKKILSGEIFFQHETQQICKDGSYIDVALTISQIIDNTGNILGISIIVRDITDLKKVQNALLKTKKKINILSSITRHDILNQLQALDAFADLLRPTITHDLKALEYLTCISLCSRKTKEHIQFSREYQDLGEKIPQWQHIETMIKMAATDTISDSVHLVIVTGNYEIFADPMLMLAFYNLFDNSNRHGQKVTTISISLTTNPDGSGILIYEDNGVGVPDLFKPHIFEKGIGDNSGLGLFLTKEILAITGLDIIENGIDGEGARFEILIPSRGLRKGRCNA